MPRAVSAGLRRMYERSNPQTRYAVELYQPDLSQILRRADQFVGAALVSQAPANSLSIDPSGQLALARGSQNLASFTVDNGSFNIGAPSPSTRFRGVWWTPDPQFTAAMAKSVTVRVHRKTTSPRTLSLQIYKISVLPVVGQNNISLLQTTFLPLLPNPVTVRTSTLPASAWVGDNASITFDLAPFRLQLRRAGIDLLDISHGLNTGEDVRYLFVVECQDAGSDHDFEWIVDSTTARTVAGVGTFWDAEFLNTTTPVVQFWSRNVIATQTPTLTLAVESVAAGSVAVYAIDLADVPSAESAGDIVFERAVPKGTVATLELSTAGAGGPWTAVTHGALVATKQQTYHLRLTLNADAANRLSPTVLGLGIRFRTVVDASLEAIVEPVAQSINTPFCEGTIGQGTISVVRTGRRDYRDVGSELAVGGAASAIEAEIHLMSGHPSITRDDWLTITRAPVSNRAPTPTSERFTLLSLLKQLQAKVPARVETVNKLYIVAASTVNQITVAATDIVSGAWNGQGYYIRVRSTTAVGLDEGYIQTIDSSIANNKIGFSAPLPVALQAGDVIEVHSGQYAQPTLAWIDADPADIWWELLTVHRAIPSERIGRAELGRAGRSGLPPRVTDRAPGDAATQAKLKVTFQLQKEDDCDKLIDQLSFLMGGATVEVAGQIVYRQIYPIRNLLGDIVIPAEAIAAVFDETNTIGLDTPAGLEQRITSLGCNYGVDTTLVSKDTPAAKTTEYVDVDALAWLAQQDLHELGHSAVPDDIARWCFNSKDGGLLLASLLCQQVVLVAATGLRVWSWGSTEQKPELVVGDRVVVVTDQYTDFDPTRQIEIRGRWAFPVVVTEVSNGGRQFRGLQTGLATAAPRIRGGAGTLSDSSNVTAESLDGLNDFKWTDSVDGLTRTYSMRAGARVKRVVIYRNVAAIPPTTDPWPPTDPAAVRDWQASGGVIEIPLIPDPATGIIHYAIAKTGRDKQTYLQFEPRLADWTAGTSRRAVLDPAPSAMSAAVKGVVTNATADLSVHVEASPSDWPVRVDVFADDPLGAVLATITISAIATIDKTTPGMAALGGLALPLREARRFYVKMTNMAGQIATGDPATLDRDALPVAFASFNDYRTTPSITVDYDDDTDQVQFKLPGGKTKTYAGLAGSGRVTYTVGDALDGAAPVELQLGFGEIRAGYQVDLTGGGTQVTVFGGALSGTLHGPIASATAQGTVSIDVDGAYSWAIDGPAVVDHYKYLENTSAYPSDASVIASVSTYAGRQISHAGASPLAFGQTVYVTAIPYDANGNAMPSIRLQGSYQSYTATKTLTFDPSSWRIYPVTGVGPAGGMAASLQYDGTSRWAQNIAMAAATPGVPVGSDFVMDIILPDGVTITSIANDANLNGSLATIIGFGANRKSGGAMTSLGTASPSATGGAQTSTLSLSESTTGRSYEIEAYMDGSFAGANAAGVFKWGPVRVTYTMPNPKVSV